MNQAFLISNIDVITLELSQLFFSLSTLICRLEERRVSAMRSDRRTIITPTISSSEAEGHGEGKAKRKHLRVILLWRKHFVTHFSATELFWYDIGLKHETLNLADFFAAKGSIFKTYFRTIPNLFWESLYSSRENKISPIGAKIVKFYILTDFFFQASFY